MGVTDDELHFRLRDRSQRFWVTGQDLLDNMLFREAADRIEQLATIREVALREAAAECQTILDEAESFGLIEIAFGAGSCREAILALIEKEI
jgi:uncharacterized Fe-S cluster-containing protein